MVELISWHEFGHLAAGALVALSQSGKSPARRLKQLLLKELAIDLFAKRKVGRLVDLVDVLISAPCLPSKALSFEDSLHFYLRFQNGDKDLIRAAHRLQVCLYGHALIEEATLNSMLAAITGQCSGVNSKLYSAVLTNRLLSVRGLNSQTEFVCAIGRILPDIPDQITSSQSDPTLKN